MKKITKTDIIRCFALVVFVAFGVMVTLALLPYIESFKTAEGRLQLVSEIQSHGLKSYLILMVVQLLQVVIAWIPGEPIELLSGMLFGAFKGCIPCLLGSFMGTVISFYMVKKIGKPLVNCFVSDEKINSMKFLHNEKKLEFIVFILFFIPGTPKDVLTYFVPLTKIQPMRFFVLSTLARIPSVITSTIVGDSFGQGNIRVSIIVYLITGVVSAIGIIIYNKIIDKKVKIA